MGLLCELECEVGLNMMDRQPISWFKRGKFGVGCSTILGIVYLVYVSRIQ